MLFCCPDCVEQYLDALRGPLNLEEQECRAFAKRMEMFIGVDPLRKEQLISLLLADLLRDENHPSRGEAQTGCRKPLP